MLIYAEMGRLKKALEQHAAALGIPRALYMPKVTQPVLIHHKEELTAKVRARQCLLNPFNARHVY